MKTTRQLFDWQGSILDYESTPPDYPVRYFATGATYMGVVSSKRAQSAAWAPLDQSGFIDSVMNRMDINPVGENWQLEEQFRAAFGYTKRVSELCQRLEKIETTLLAVVSKLDRSSQPHQSLWVPIVSFAPAPYEVVKPLTAVVTPVEDGFEAGLFEANLFSTGDTEVEAINNLKSVIVENFALFEELGDSKLGPGPRKQREILSALIRKVG
jgi:hypothetical protein